MIPRDTRCMGPSKEGSYTRFEDRVASGLQNTLVHEVRRPPALKMAVGSAKVAKADSDEYAT
jgi:hypothetical protein